MIRLSPGILVSSHQLLKRMHEYENVNILSALSKQQSIDGTKTSDVIDTVQECEWVQVVNEEFKLTPRGVLFALKFDHFIKRLMISDYIRHSDEPWIQLIPRGRKECSSYLHSDVLTCIKSAGLLDIPASDDVVLWWDQQAQAVRKEQELTSLEIGRIGEKMTIKYEKKRTRKLPVWKSIESNLAGYDVLSILKKGSKSHLTIEVKTSEKPIKSAIAFITRHEWNVAINSANHVFHFWNIDRDVRKLAVLLPTDVEDHVPKDQGVGSWDSVSVCFDTFSHKFEIVNIE